MFSAAIVLVLISAFHRATDLQNWPGIEENCFEAIQTDGTYYVERKALRCDPGKATLFMKLLRSGDVNLL